MVTSGAIAAATATVATSTTGASGKIHVAWSGRSRCLRKSLRMSTRGWRIGGPTRPSSRHRTLRMAPTSTGSTDGHGHDLDARGEAGADDGRDGAHPIIASAASTSDEGTQPVGQVAVDTARLQSPGRLPPPADGPDDGSVEPALDGVVHRVVERDRLDEVPRFGDVAHVEVLDGTKHVVEDPLDRLGERRGRVLHAGRLELATTSPRLDHARRGLARQHAAKDEDADHGDRQGTGQRGWCQHASEPDQLEVDAVSQDAVPDPGQRRPHRSLDGREHQRGDDAEHDAHRHQQSHGQAHRDRHFHGLDRPPPSAAGPGSRCRPP